MEGDDPDWTWIMPKVTARAAVLTALLLVALAGCAGAPESAPSEPEPASASASETPTEETAAPATVEPTEPTGPSDVEVHFLESAFIAQIELPDADKLAAGRYACEQIEAGNGDVVAVEGLDPALNEVFVSDSVTLLCPELSSVYDAG